MQAKSVCALAAGAALAGAPCADGDVITTFDDALDAGVVIGSGIPNANFVVTTNTDRGVQVGVKALERFIGDLPNTGSRYFAQLGESPQSGAAGAPPDPGTATWNYLYSVDLGPNLTFGEVEVNVAIDFNPAPGNSDFFEFELVSGLAAQGIDITPDSLFQDSQNLGFDFWQAIGDPNIQPFNPFAAGEYFMSVDVVETATGGSLAGVSMLVDVVPAPGSIALMGLAAAAGARRRRRGSL